GCAPPSARAPAAGWPGWRWCCSASPCPGAAARGQAWSARSDSRRPRGDCARSMSRPAAGRKVATTPPMNMVTHMLAWQEDLETGIDVIDTQHRRIVEMINQLDLARRSGVQATVVEVLDELVDYTLSHF